jgi:hypothetical protein
MAITSFMWLPLKSVVPVLADQIDPSRFFPVAKLAAGIPFGFKPVRLDRKNQ